MTSTPRSSAAAPTPDAPAVPGAPLSYLVQGMDCANCVAKVERMVGGLPGAGGVSTSFTRQTLTLQLDETRTPRHTLEQHLRSLGYVPTLQGEPAAPAAPEHAHAQAPTAGPGQPWYRSPQGRLVVVSGTLLAAAWVLGFAAPGLSTAAFVAATLLGVWPLAGRAVASARLGDPFSINLLVSLAAVGAVLIGEAAEGAVVVFFFSVGELLEGIAAGRARAGIQALAALTPKTALLLPDGPEGPGGASGVAREVAADTLRAGQTVQVNPGARVPADGTVLRGTSGVDDSPVTGESVPALKGVGDPVFAGSINGDGVLTVRVDREASDNTIARITAMVEEAAASRAPTARFIDRFSRAYTPGVVLVSALVAAAPPLLLGGDWHTWLYRGISLLLIGCPCALVLSVPAAITSGVSAGARRGLLIKGGAALESIGNARTVAFDKTGTLTAGHPRVTDLHPLAGTRDDLLRLAAAAEAGSSHPLARAVLDAARGLNVPPATDARALPGLAVTARLSGEGLGGDGLGGDGLGDNGAWAGQEVTVSSPRHAATLTTLAPDVQAQVARLEGQGRTAVIVLLGGPRGPEVRGVIGLRDEPRPDAAPTLAALRRLGIGTVMLTGDNARTAHAIAGDLHPGGADHEALEVHADLLPGDKLRIIRELQARGPVVMLGDGINDAPALAQADVGVAMGGGTDVALETADAALLREQVSGVADLIALSRATMSNIRVNIAFALGLKAVFLITTLLGYTNLWMAILADTGATALVTANALRLLRWKPRAVPGTPAPTVRPEPA
ncbi:ATPase [Deinococcus seoulensis]|uniref:ATPase n=1 Tax=Deinococcus seoulensis TaxID=1837379 RepID=A0ABQ2RSW2_9DEIO|nr:ATPase [Deinococcus seoulensis]